jgi:hypothetical protein
MFPITVTLLALAALPAEDAARLKAPEIRFVAVVENQGHRWLQIEVTNPNDAPLPYIGYTAESFSPPIPEGRIEPFYRVELKTDDWKPLDVPRCGTGKGPVVIGARKKVTFDVLMPPGAWSEARVGLTWFTSADRRELGVAWCPPISRKDTEKKP